MSESLAVLEVVGGRVDLDDHSKAVNVAGTMPQSTAASAMSLSSATRLAVRSNQVKT